MNDTGFKNDHVILKEVNGVKFLQFQNLLKYQGMIQHCFTTRIGGVSKSPYYSLNMGFHKQDETSNVLENYNRVAFAIDVPLENLVLSNQVHGKTIIQVNEINKGSGISKNQLEPCDGLTTQIRDVALVTFYADCVPVFIFDPVQKAISLVHSGWKGTLLEVSAKAVRTMVDQYNTRPKDLEIVIGPSIRKCCFEVHDDVYKEFQTSLEWGLNHCNKNSSGKWHFDLQRIIRESLCATGVCEENILDSEICTKCNRDLFFSYRGDRGKTGNLAAILVLR